MMPTMNGYAKDFYARGNLTLFYLGFRSKVIG